LPQVVVDPCTRHSQGSHVLVSTHHLLSTQYLLAHGPWQPNRLASSRCRPPYHRIQVLRPALQTLLSSSSLLPHQLAASSVCVLPSFTWPLPLLLLPRPPKTTAWHIGVFPSPSPQFAFNALDRALACWSLSISSRLRLQILPAAQSKSTQCRLLVFCLSICQLSSCLCFAIKSLPTTEYPSLLPHQAIITMAPSLTTHTSFTRPRTSDRDARPVTRDHNDQNLIIPSRTSSLHSRITQPIPSTLAGKPQQRTPKTLTHAYMVCGVGREPSQWVKAPTPSQGKIGHMKGAVGQFWLPEILGSSPRLEQDNDIARSLHAAMRVSLLDPSLDSTACPVN